MSVVIGGWSADGGGRGAAGTRQRRGHGGRLEGAAVERPRLEGTARGSVALGQRGGGSLGNIRRENKNLHSDDVQNVSKHWPGLAKLGSYLSRLPE